CSVRLPWCQAARRPDPVATLLESMDIAPPALVESLALNFTIYAAHERTGAERHDCIRQWISSSPPHRAPMACVLTCVLVRLRQFKIDFGIALFRRHLLFKHHSALRRRTHLAIHSTSI